MTISSATTTRQADARDSRELLERRYRGEAPLRTLLALYSEDYGRLGLAMLVYIVKHSPAWAMPLVTANIINIITAPQRHPLGELWLNAAVLSVLLVQNIPTHYLYIRLISAAIRNMETRLRSTICRRLQHLSIGYYAQASTGALQTKVLRDVEVLEQLTRQVFQEVPAIALTMIVAVAVTATRAPWFLLFFLLAVPLAVLIVTRLRKPIEQRNRSFRREVESMSGSLIEMIHMIPITRAHAVERHEIARVEEKLEEVRDAGLRLDAVNAVFGATAWVTFQSFNAACLVLAAAAAYTGLLPITVGDVVLMTGYFGTLTNSVMNLTNMLPQITKGFESIRSIGEVLESPDLERNEGKQKVSGVRGDFRFERVSFTYGHESAALHEINLEVRAGETIALVGPSGAGKSTFLNLVIGFLRPTAGRILLDGRDMAELDLRSFRRFLAVVPQDVILFDGTIRENILYGAKRVPEEKLMGAVQDANLHEFLHLLPQGLETRVGERGARLSGGQKQRIAIARALVRDPRVLVLDEATSALDSASEALIQEALARLMRGRTSFVVAHRLSTIRHANRIAVMQEGRIVEVGSHGDLLARGGAYARLHGLQSA